MLMQQKKRLLVLFNVSTTSILVPILESQYTVYFPFPFIIFVVAKSIGVRVVIICIHISKREILKEKNK